MGDDITADADIFQQSLDIFNRVRWCTEHFGELGVSGWQLTRGYKFVFDDPNNELMFKLVWG